MIKMLKKQNDALHYWEVWYDEDEKTFTVHYGQVGERGEHFTEKKKRGIDVETHMEKLARQQTESGYELLDEDLFKPIVIQYTVDGNDIDADLDKQDEVESLMNECLGWTGNGYCDGSDYGSGTMNIFSFTLDQELALQTIRAELEEHDLLKGSIIAYMENDQYISAYPTRGDTLQLI